MKEGYSIISNFISKKEHLSVLDYCKSDFYNQSDVEYDNKGRVNKIKNACLNYTTFYNLANNKILVAHAKKLLNTTDTLDCYISKFFPMEPNGGTSTFLHQDNYYFRGDNNKIVSCAVYLTNTSKKNGCLRVVPNSHKKGILEHTIESNVSKYIKWIPEENCDNIVDLELEGPSAVFFDINLIHGCYSNNSEEYRYSLAWEYIETSNNSVVPGDRITLH